VIVAMVGCGLLLDKPAKSPQTGRKLNFFAFCQICQRDFNMLATCGGDGIFDRLDELARRRVAGRGNSHDDLGARLVDLHGSEETELGEAVEKRWVNDGAHGLFDGTVRICHQRGGNRVIRILGDLGSCPS
jgi:hypothetical protein